MKRFKKIYTIAFAMLALCSCEHNAALENEDINIPIPENGYIFFDAGVNSRGVLEHGETDQKLLHKDFYVLGYKYKADDWYTAKGMLTSTNNVFEDTPQLVEYKDGIHTYSNSKSWENYTYSFFAWYPSTLKDIVSYSGTPYISYTLSRTNPAEHQDVMKAYVVNRVPSSVKSVQLNMEHCLSALDITATSYVKATDFDNYTGAVNIKISSVTIELTDLLYDKVEIPLNPYDKINGTTVELSNKGYNTAATDDDPIPVVNFNNLNLIGQEATVTENGFINLTSNDNVSNTMILIPQDQPLKGKVTVEYSIVGDNNRVLAATKTHNSEILTIGNLVRNTRYELLLNFTKSGVTIEVIKGANWDDAPNVEHEFE